MQRGKAHGHAYARGMRGHGHEACNDTWTTLTESKHTQDHDTHDMAWGHTHGTHETYGVT